MKRVHWPEAKAIVTKVAAEVENLEDIEFVSSHIYNISRCAWFGIAKNLSINQLFRAFLLPSAKLESSEQNEKQGLVIQAVSWSLWQRRLITRYTPILQWIQNCLRMLCALNNFDVMFFVKWECCSLASSRSLQGLRGRRHDDWDATEFVERLRFMTKWNVMVLLLWCHFTRTWKNLTFEPVENSPSPWNFSICILHERDKRRHIVETTAFYWVGQHAGDAQTVNAVWKNLLEIHDKPADHQRAA